MAQSEKTQKETDLSRGVTVVAVYQHCYLACGLYNFLSQLLLSHPLSSESATQRHRRICFNLLLTLLAPRLCKSGLNEPQGCVCVFVPTNKHAKMPLVSLLFSSESPRTGGVYTVLREDTDGEGNTITWSQKKREKLCSVRRTLYLFN